ncbi:Hypothetical_protein [Hexamita inflata]|uniref:Hypothetical_protein n=1 Tax=Hexamita inflata TaxID=28002 RepID=A0AA86TMV3_9EUKA|nr:Hypothetical protein HINF_LOCUS9750 [Hexamita inflata]
MYLLSSSPLRTRLLEPSKRPHDKHSSPAHLLLRTLLACCRLPESYPDGHRISDQLVEIVNADWIEQTNVRVFIMLKLIEQLLLYLQTLSTRSQLVLLSSWRPSACVSGSFSFIFVPS